MNLAAAAADATGMLRGGAPPLPEVVSVMAGYGIDITAHRSRLVGRPAEAAHRACWPETRREPLGGSEETRSGRRAVATRLTAPPAPSIRP